MDSEALVNEQIEAGAELVRRLEGSVPVTVAFWAKPTVDEKWYLYIASERIGDASIRPVYEILLRVTGEMKNPNMDPFRVKFIRPDDPRARSALDIFRLYSDKMPVRYNGYNLGNTSIEGAYIYPLPDRVAG